MKHHKITGTMNYFYNLPEDLQELILSIRSITLIQNYWRQYTIIMVEKRFDDAYDRMKHENDDGWWPYTIFNRKWDLP